MDWHPVKALRRATAIVGLAALPVIGLPAAGHAAPTPTVFAFSGQAYGTSVSVGTLAKSGPTAYAVLGCSAVPGVSSTNNSVATHLKVGSADLGTTGTTVDSVKGDVVNGLSTTTATADVQSVDLLGGLIKAGALHSLAQTTGAPVTNSGSATFVGLKIAGIPINASPAPNTKIDLGPVGYVVLNEQIARAPNANNGGMTVNAMHVVVLNLPGIGSKVDVIIGQAVSGLNAAPNGVMQGYAYGSNLSLLHGIVGSGRTAYQPLPCLGTKGAVKTNSTAGLNLPGALNSGTVTSSVTGTIDATHSTATVSNTTQAVDLLGRIQVDAITTQLSGDRPAGGTQTLTDQSVFVGLTIDGTTYGGTPATNTRIALPGLGTLWLHRMVTLSNGVTELRSIELILSTAAGGLPAGTDLKVGVVGLSLHG